MFTDLRMPEMSGIDLAYNIRKLDEKVKILLITAFEIEDLKNIKALEMLELKW